MTTTPTPAGETTLDPFHPLGAVKRLREKQLREMDGTDQFLRILQVGQGRGVGVEGGPVCAGCGRLQGRGLRATQKLGCLHCERGGAWPAWLIAAAPHSRPHCKPLQPATSLLTTAPPPHPTIHHHHPTTTNTHTTAWPPRRQAEKEGLVKVEMQHKELGSVVSQLAELYTSGGTAASSQAWDALRRRVVEECVTAHLLPALEREARVRQAHAARGVVAQQMADRLWAYARQAPLQVRGVGAVWQPWGWVG